MDTISARPAWILVDISLASWWLSARNPSRLSPRATRWGTSQPIHRRSTARRVGGPRRVGDASPASTRAAPVDELGHAAARSHRSPAPRRAAPPKLRRPRCRDVRPAAFARSPPATVKEHDMTNRRTTARDLAQIAIFAALIAALGLPGTITVGSTGVPITLQTLGIMLAGGILGARKGFLSVLVFLVLVSARLPLLAGGRGGLGVWAGPSAGYLIGWLVGAAVIGWLTARILPTYPLWLGIVINIVGGVLIVYACGVAVLAFRIGFVPAITSNFLYLPGDWLKVLVASIVVKQVHRAYPGLIGPAATGEPGPADTAVAADTAAPADAPAVRSAAVDGTQPADGPVVKP